jgi:hypothetical protein
MLRINKTSFDGLIAQANRYYGKVLYSNEQIANDARELILARVSQGITTEGRKMGYKNVNDKFKGRWRLKGKRVGDYAESYVEQRYKANVGTNPMDLKTDGGLHKAFTYRKKKSAKTFSIEFYIRKNKNSKYQKNYQEIHGWLQSRFGDIFHPSKKEVNIIAKMWKKRMK